MSSLIFLVVASLERKSFKMAIVLMLSDLNMASPRLYSFRNYSSVIKMCLWIFDNA